MSDVDFDKHNSLIAEDRDFLIERASVGFRYAILLTTAIVTGASFASAQFSGKVQTIIGSSSFVLGASSLAISTMIFLAVISVDSFDRIGPLFDPVFSSLMGLEESPKNPLTSLKKNWVSLNAISTFVGYGNFLLLVSSSFFLISILNTLGKAAWLISGGMVFGVIVLGVILWWRMRCIQMKEIN